MPKPFWKKIFSENDSTFIQFGDKDWHINSNVKAGYYNLLRVVIDKLNAETPGYGFLYGGGQEPFWHKDDPNKILTIWKCTYPEGNSIFHANLCTQCHLTDDPLDCDTCSYQLGISSRNWTLHLRQEFYSEYLGLTNPANLIQTAQEFSKINIDKLELITCGSFSEYDIYLHDKALKSYLCSYQYDGYPPAEFSCIHKDKHEELYGQPCETTPFYFFANMLSKSVNDSISLGMIDKDPDKIVTYRSIHTPFYNIKNEDKIKSQYQLWKMKKNEKKLL